MAVISRTHMKTNKQPIIMHLCVFLSLCLLVCRSRNLHMGSGYILNKEGPNQDSVLPKDDQDLQKYFKSANYLCLT